MATSLLVDLTAIQVRSGGTGPLTLGAAATASRGTEALQNGGTYSYSVQQNDDFETGQCVYMAGSLTIVRTPRWSSNGNAAINVLAGSIINFTLLAADVLASQQSSVSAVIAAMVSGDADFSALPDEANGDTVPTAGSGQLYLSGGNLKVA
jgi:hypothetical protein